MSEMALFNHDDKYTTVASDLHAEATNTIKSLMLTYVRMGYSVREVAHIVQGAVHDCECEIMLTPHNER